MPNICDRDQHVTKLNNGTIADAEMVCNVLSSNKNGNELLNELLSRFPNSNNASNLKYSDSIKKQKMFSFEPSRKKKKGNLHN